MAYQYVTYPIKDLGAGVDQQSAENSISEGYCELINNADPEPMGYIAKRLGYQRHAGQLPVRVTKVEYNEDATNNLCFFLDSEIDISSINLLTTRRSPIVVQGRTSSQNSFDAGDFPNSSDSVNYYPTFDSDVESVFNNGANTIQNDGLGTEDVFVHLSRKTSFSNTSNSVFIPDAVTIDSFTGNVEVDYVNNTGSTFEGYLYLSRKAAEVGTTYVSAKVGGSVLSAATGTSTVTIPTTTHRLSNFNIDTRLYRIDGNDRIEVYPDEVEIASNGDVSFTITNNTGSAFDFVAYLTAYPAANVAFGPIADGAPGSLQFSLTTQDFIGAVVYLEDSPGGTKRKVIPESIEVDSDTSTATVTFTNNTGANTKFFIYWEEIEITSNKLCVDATQLGVGEGYTDTAPQLTLWGLNHEVIYGQGAVDQRPGWVTHIDSYKSEGDNRLVAGLGGNLFTESSDRDAYLLPVLYPNLSGRVSTDRYVGPTFYTTGEQSGLAASIQRTRGWIESDDVVEGRLQATSITWQSGTTVRYTFEIGTSSALPSSIISTASGLEDYLEVTSAANERNNGTHRIVGVTQSGTTVNIDVENTSVQCADFNESDTSAFIGIFTDQIPLLSTSKFVVDDAIASDLFSFDAGYSVSSNSGTTTVLSGLSDYQLIPAGLRLVARRETNVVPLRDVDGNGSVEGLVQFDSLTYTPITRKLTVRYVNPRDDEAVSITGDGSTATITLSTSSNVDYSVGQSILLRQAGEYSGEHTITGIPAVNQLSFSSIATSSTAGTIVGYTINIDESLMIEDSISNANTVSVDRRWAPIEAPTDDYELTADTYIQHFDSNEYSNQPYLRSTMVADNLYCTNGADELMKYDGTSLYRAGLPRWQPQLFITTSTSAAAEIDYTPSSVTVNSVSGTVATVDAGEQLQFSVGEIVRDQSGNRYSVLELYESGSTGAEVGKVRLDSDATGATELNSISFVRYYFRLNAVDSNRNIVASAVVGSEDTTIELSEATQVRLRLVGFPAWHIYDYERLEVEVYRTAVGTEAPYYRLTTLPMQFNGTDGYVDFTDSYSGEQLRNLDVVNTALLGGTELGTQWSEPLRARYVTSAGNRLVLANLTDYPELDIRLESEGLKFADLSGQRWLFRKDNEDAVTTSDLDNRQAYEFVSAATGTISGIVNNADSSFTISTAGTLPAVGDWVYLYHSAVADDHSVQYAGWFQVDSIGAGSFTCLHDHTTAGYTPGAEDVDSYVLASTSGDVPVLLAEDGNYAQSNYNPLAALNDDTNLALIRLANAINVSMRATANPWIIAGAGGDFNSNQLVVRQPRVEDAFLEVQLPTHSGYSIFVNSILRDSDEQVSASTRLYPSRLIVSGNNYPEIFDNPRAAIDSTSRSAIDVNSADGEQITGVIPFFGEAAFGSAQKDSIIVVFKEASIYLVNLAAKEAGQSAVQKLESQGLGCTAPYSIAVTRDGILFANRSGMFRLTKQLTIEYVGRRVERLWESEVNLDALDEAVGHHYSIGRQYKLSYPITGNRENSKVFVYNHTREYTEGKVGSWTQYDNHPATGWANLLSNAYFSTSAGSVMLLRNTGDVSDYRDDDEAISMEVRFRAIDFGDAAIRKAVSSVLVHFRNLADQTGTQVFSATDLDTVYQQLDDFQIVNNSRAVVSIQFSVNRRKGLYFQFRLTNNTIDEPVEVAGFDIRVAGASDRAILQAANTQ